MLFGCFSLPHDNYTNADNNNTNTTNNRFFVKLTKVTSKAEVLEIYLASTNLINGDASCIKKCQYINQTESLASPLISSDIILHSACYGKHNLLFLTYDLCVNTMKKRKLVVSCRPFYL